MTGFNRTRRRFLASTALTGFGLLGAIRAAWAFSEQPMNAAAHKAYRNACSAGGDAYHTQLLQQAETELGERMSVAEMTLALAAMRCPICGCPLVASAPSDKAAQPG